MIKLKNISEIHAGYNLRNIKNVNPQRVYLVSAKDLSTNFKNASKINVPSSYKNYLKNNDILVKSRGASYEAKIFKNPDYNHFYIAANTLIIVRLITNDYKPSYITHLINSKNTQQFLRSLSSGQTVPILSPSSLGSLNCPRLSLEKQRKLETISRTIDNYQSALAKYAETGEQLAKALKTELMKGMK